MKYYTITKGGKTITVDSIAQAYEMWDCLGRADVAIEHHAIEDGNHYRWDVAKITRRTSKKYGRITYHATLGNCIKAEA